MPGTFSGKFLIYCQNNEYSATYYADEKDKTKLTGTGLNKSKIFWFSNIGTACKTWGRIQKRDTDLDRHQNKADPENR